MTEMLLTEIDHVAIAVNDLPAAVAPPSSTARSSTATASRRPS